MAEMFTGMGVMTSVGMMVTISQREKLLGRAVREDELEPLDWQTLQKARTYTAEQMFLARGSFDTGGRILDQFLNQYDLILTPTTAAPSPLLGKLSLNQPYESFMGEAMKSSPYTALFNMSGQPAMSVPMHWTADNVPVGAHLRPFGREGRLLRLAAQQANRSMAGRMPDLSVFQSVISEGRVGMTAALHSKQRGKEMGICNQRTVVITGAGGGLGRAYALAFAQKVQMWWSTTSVPKLLRPWPMRSRPQAVRPLTRATSPQWPVRSILDATLAAFGDVNVIVNNAGVLRDRMFLSLTEEDWDMVMRAPARPPAWPRCSEATGAIRRRRAGCGCSHHQHQLRRGPARLHRTNATPQPRLVSPA